MKNEKKISKKQSGWFKLYKHVVSILTIVAIPRMISASGLITWRNDNAHHWRYLYSIIKNALDNNQIHQGIKMCMSEFIFNLLHLGDWIKFALMLTTFILIVRLIPKIFSFSHKTAQALEKPFLTIYNHTSDALTKFSFANVLPVVGSVLRYNIIPASDSQYNTLSIAIEKDGKQYYGGIRLSKPVCKIPRLHMISKDGEEIDHVLGRSLIIVRKKSCVYLCGSFIDENNTKQRKQIICDHKVQIGITSHFYSLQATK